MPGFDVALCDVQGNVVDVRLGDGTNDPTVFHERVRFFGNALIFAVIRLRTDAT